jgi:hypothetical protein
MAATEVKSLAEQKRELLERSQQCRAALAADCVELGASLSWVSRTLQVAKAISPLLVVAAPLAGWFARKKMRDGKAKASKHGPDENKKKVGLIAAAWQGFRLYRQVAPFIQGFMKAWPATRPPRPNSNPGAPVHVRTRSERS